MLNIISSQTHFQVGGEYLCVPPLLESGEAEDETYCILTCGDVPSLEIQCDLGSWSKNLDDITCWILFLLVMLKWVLNQNSKLSWFPINILTLLFKSCEVHSCIEKSVKPISFFNMLLESSFNSKMVLVGISISDLAWTF